MMYETEIVSGAPEPLTVTGPQPVWMTLNEARERTFTGELVFAGDPEVVAYLDHGVVYYAERSTDVPLGRRLVEAGVLDQDQLDRGTVRVGEIEHLGRLFDRDPSIDRDAVLVVTETSTGDLVERLANEVVADVAITAFRHHPSGVHRWFVAPVEQMTSPRPAGVVSPLDAGVFDDLPGTTPSVDDLVDELTIEWDEPFDGAHDIEVLTPVDDLTDDPFVVEPTLPGGDLDEHADAGDDSGADSRADAGADAEGLDVQPVDMTDFVDLDTDAGEVTADDDEVTADEEIGVAHKMEIGVPDEMEIGVADEMEIGVAEVADAEDATSEEDAAFDVIWPDGTIDTVDATAQEATAVEDHVEDDVESFDGDDGDDVLDEVHFEIPELAVAEDDDVATDQVSDDVADAVRRALAAIEHAGQPEVAPVAPAAPVDGSALEAPAPAAQGIDSAPAPAAPMAFAPPTLDTSAEAIYAREAAQADMSAEPALPASAGSADDGDGSERTSALRRLIRSLGRKDR